MKPEGASPHLREAPTSAPRIARWRVDLALVSVAMIWGVTFVLVKQALEDISTLLFLTVRFTFATIALTVLFFPKARADAADPVRLRHSLQAGLFAGLCLFSGYVFQTFGLKYTSAAKTGFITGLYIPLVPLFGAFVYKKLPKIAELFGVGLAFLGMALMTLQGNSLAVSFGDLLVMGCAVAYAIHILVLGHFAPRVSTPILTVTQIASAAVLGAATFWWVEPVRVRWSSDVWVALGVTSLLATAAAFAIQTWAQQYTSPTRTALIFSMEPVFAWATSYLLLRETLSPRGILGALLILAGIFAVELKPPGSSEHQTN